MQAAAPDNAQLLAQLRDIHAAGDPGWWPPAPGWWGLAALALFGLFLILRAMARRWVKLRRRRAWLRALEALDQQWDPRARPHDYLAGVNRLFRAVALKAFPEARCGHLQGDEWVAFISALLPDGKSADCLTALARGPYEPQPEFDAVALREQARLWVTLYG